MAANPTDCILVIGSRPDQQLPSVRCVSVYSANGACEVARTYASTFELPPKLIAVVGSSALGKPELFERVRTSRPDRLVVRGPAHHAAPLRSEIGSRMQIDSLDAGGLGLQRKYFSSKMLRRSHTTYLGNYSRPAPALKTFRLLVNRGDDVFGLSTGIFAALLAHHENRDSAIVLSGIGAGIGGREHFYSRPPMSRKRVAADRYLLRHLPSGLRERLMTTEPDVAKAYGWPLLSIS